MQTTPVTPQDTDSNDAHGADAIAFNVIQVVNSVCADFDGNGLYSIGASAALQAMLYHWAGHVAEGHPATIVSSDIHEAMRELSNMRAEIARRLGLSDKNVDSTAVALDPKDALIAQLQMELAEADRRAGAAERKNAGLQDTIDRANNSRDKQKAEAGYDRNVSFDRVWDEILAKAQGKK